MWPLAGQGVENPDGERLGHEPLNVVFCKPSDLGGLVPSAAALRRSGGIGTPAR